MSISWGEWVGFLGCGVWVVAVVSGLEKRMMLTLAGKGKAMAAGALLRRQEIVR